MKGRSLVISLMLLGCLNINANPIDRPTALGHTRAFMKAKGFKANIVEPQENAKTKQIAKRFDSYIYLFNIEGGGIVVSSGDDALPVVLGYSTSKNTKCEGLADEFISCLQIYSNEVKAYQKGGVEAVQQVMHAPIQKMMDTKWGQDEPFNGACPDFFGKGKTLTGCVATAMAQVLYYHHTNPNSVSATTKEIAEYDGDVDWSGYGPLHVDAVPDSSLIDWNNMQAVYGAKSTAVQKKAVADLMLYCGAALHTSYCNYHNGGSVASLANVPDALKDYFGFTKGTRFVKKSTYASDEAWDNAIYDELAAGRPMMLAMQDRKGGHVFVVDGYNEGYYHINWGWAGLSDGYFMLSAITTAHSNSDMEAVVGAIPDDGTFTEVPTLTATEFKVTKTEVMRYDNGYPCEYNIKATNRMANTYTFELALGIFNEQGELIKTTNQLSKGMTVAYNTTGSFSGTAIVDMPTGTYVIFPVCRARGTEEWQKMLSARGYLFEATPTGGNYK